MNLIRKPRPRLMVCALAAIVAGCSGGTLSSVGAPNNGVSKLGSVRGSWILPNAGKQWLLYVSDYSSDTVDIYNYRVKAGKLYGQITGFSHPLGECVDSAGNVYVADFRDNEIFEYAHGGITPVAAAYDYYGRPNGCAVDASTGNIAVTNGVTISSPGSVLIFSGGLSGSQTVIDGSYLRLDNPAPPAYDPSGNLFFEAQTYSTDNIFVELPAGSSTLQQLNGLTIGGAASVQWDGAYIAAADANYQNTSVAAINRVTVSGSAVTVIRTTVLTDTCSSGDYVNIYQPFIGGTTKKLNVVIAGNTSCSNRLDFWSYAQGGNPKRVISSNIAPVSPGGVALSPPTSGVR
ncbi:MAG: hypothetical protein WBE30_04750 [Candidatus Cybelea sp.]